MKTVYTFLFAALLPLAACSPSPEAPRVPWTSPFGIKLPDKPVYVLKDETFCYVRLHPKQNARLRHALANATTLQVEVESFFGTKPGSQTHTLSRDKTEGLAARLDEIAAVSQWLDTRAYSGAFDICLAGTLNLRLLDADGKPLWDGDPTYVAYQPQKGAAPVSLDKVIQPYLPSEH